VRATANAPKSRTDSVKNGKPPHCPLLNHSGNNFNPCQTVRTCSIPRKIAGQQRCYISAKPATPPHNTTQPALFANTWEPTFKRRLVPPRMLLMIQRWVTILTSCPTALVLFAEKWCDATNVANCQNPKIQGSRMAQKILCLLHNRPLSFTLFKVEFFSGILTDGHILFSLSFLELKRNVQNVGRWRLFIFNHSNGLLIREWWVAFIPISVPKVLTSGSRNCTLFARPATMSILRFEQGVGRMAGT
jgi:hypothetical protein